MSYSHVIRDSQTLLRLISKTFKDQFYNYNELITRSFFVKRRSGDIFDL